MKPGLLLRYALYVLLAAGIIYLAVKLPSMDVGSQFAITVIGGVIVGLLAVKYLVPRIGEAAGNFFYSSGAVVEQDDFQRASAKVAQGDYAGAVAEYEAWLEEKPDDTLAIQEAAKLKAQKLGDPAGALHFLEERLQGREWTPDQAVFLMFRISELHLDMHNYAAAETVLQQVVSEFPKSRYSSNAKLRLSEIREVEFKAMTQGRLKTGGSAS